jgi:hypothetical protein
VIFSLHAYDGPATVDGIPFSDVRLRENADRIGTGVIKRWEGTAHVSKREAPNTLPAWFESYEAPVPVQLPSGGTGNAHLIALTLTDGLWWDLELAGAGPSPMDDEEDGPGTITA